MKDLADNGTKAGSAARIIIIPTRIFMGNPITNTFICGTARTTIPRPMSTQRIAEITGRASFIPIAKISRAIAITAS